MNDVPAPLIAAVAGALAGVLGGGLVAALGFWYRRRTERKQLLRSALYTLLRAWRPIQRAASVDGTAFAEVFSDMLSQEWARATGTPVRPLAQAAIDPALSRQVERMLRGQLLRVDRPSPSALTHALDDVARFHPALALDINAVPYEAIFDATPDVPLPPDVRERATAALETFGLAQFLERTERDLKRLAFWCGPWTWCAVLWKLRSQRELDWDDFRVRAAPFVRELVATAIQRGGGSTRDDPPPGHTPTAED